jgi:hypothetical protein
MNLFGRRAERERQDRIHLTRHPEAGLTFDPARGWVDLRTEQAEGESWQSYLSSRQAQHEAELQARAAEAEQLDASRAAREEARRQTLPEHLQ